LGADEIPEPQHHDALVCRDDLDRHEGHDGQKAQDSQSEHAADLQCHETLLFLAASALPPAGSISTVNPLTPLMMTPCPFLTRAPPSARTALHSSPRTRITPVGAMSDSATPRWPTSVPCAVRRPASWDV